MEAPAGHPALQAVILAAGKDAIAADGGPLILEPLGDCSILECVVQNALQLVSPDRLIVVVGCGEEEVRRRLGTAYRYVLQTGRGHLSTSLAHLANISYRVGRKLQFDGASETFGNDGEANRFLSREYRAPFVVPNKV